MNWSKKYQTEQWYKNQEEKNKQLEEEMVEKIKADKEFVQNLPPEKQTEYKLFKIFFSIFMVVFFLAADYGYRHGILLQILIPEAVIALIAFILWKIKPKKIKFPSVCMMPVIAFALTLLGLGGFMIGDFLEGNFVSKNIVAEQKEEIIENGTTIEISEDKKTGEVSEYELWLKENNIIQGDD